MDGGGIGGHQHVEFPKSISDRPTVEAHDDLTRIGIDIVDIADVAVVDLLVIVVLDLHDFVTGGKSPAKPLHLAIAGGIERCLQLDIQRTRSDAAAVHRAQHLDLPDGIEAEPSGDSCFYKVDDTRHGGFGIVRLHKVEVAV